MCGALASTCVKRYVGFDPNTNLVAGYKKIQQDFGHHVEIEDTAKSYIRFDSGHEIYSLPFETCDRFLVDDNDLFDFAFTSPPFFDYEEYTAENPTYKDWYVEFYEPLFVLTEKRLIPGAFFAVHIDDTSAGKIRDFLFRRVAQITSFRYRGKIGLVGGKSGKIRNVFLFSNKGPR
jgi:hypothetical protein